MIDTGRPLCDCPEPCGCYAEGYAAGKDKAFFEMEMALQDETHAAGCGCQPCQTKRACLRKAKALMASGSLALLTMATGTEHPGTSTSPGKPRHSP